MKAILSLLLLLLCSCQSAYIIKADQLPSNKESLLNYSFARPDQERISLKELLSDKQGLVAIFWQSTCPCVSRYQERVNDLSARYAHLGLAFAHISSNENESFFEVQKEYQKRAISLPLLRDEQGIFAKDLRVKGTPTAVLIDKNGTVRFMGWIDNERKINEAGRVAYLEDAIKEFLANEPIKNPTSPMFGCAIR